jgi:hypothetical protein
MRANKLTGAALDWAVAKCEGATDEWHTDKPFFWDGVPCVREAGHDVEYTPSTDWAQGGPIIEREGIDLQYQGGDTDKWAADMFGAECSVYGDTPLVAAMRCYVTSKLGDEIEVPEDLNKEQA